MAKSKKGIMKKAVGKVVDTKAEEAKDEAKVRWRNQVRVRKLKRPKRVVRRSQVLRRSIRIYLRNSN